MALVRKANGAKRGFAWWDIITTKELTSQELQEMAEAEMIGILGFWDHRTMDPNRFRFKTESGLSGKPGWKRFIKQLEALPD